MRQKCESCKRSLIECEGFVEGEREYCRVLGFIIIFISTVLFLRVFFFFFPFYIFVLDFFVFVFYFTF